MNIEILITFIAFNILNVIIQTVKSLVTIKCGKTLAALVNAVAYGLYTYIIVLTSADLPMLLKCVIVALANLVGVYVVKYFEEKARKDKLWKVEATIPRNATAKAVITDHLSQNNIPYNYIDIKKYYLISCYCSTQKQSLAVKEVLTRFNAKYFVVESKEL